MTPTQTLADLAVAHPAASRVFERFGLDYCCGGRRPLADAARDRDIDVRHVLEAIAAEEAGLPDAPRWDGRPLPELVAFIQDVYHRRLREELPELIAMAEKVERVHAEKPTCPRGLRDHLAVVHRSVLDHLEKEERILFPMIVAGLGARAGAPIHVMEVEHDDHRENLERIRTLTAGLQPPAEACVTWRALYLRLAALERDLHEHIHLENNVLFPRALAA